MANGGIRISPRMAQRTPRKWLVTIGIVLATLSLFQTGHGAVIKRENSVDEQELVAEELLAAVTPAAEKQLDALIDGTKENDAIRDANRISETAAETKKVAAEKTKVNATTTTTKPVVAVEEDGDEMNGGGATVEPFDAVRGSVTDTPIPTFPPSDVNRYTSSYRDEGVAESESLRETNGRDFTTVDYEQRYERIEMTTVQPTSAELSPAGMFQQESTRFDAKGVKMEHEETTIHEAHESATIVNLDGDGVKEIATTDRNSSTLLSNVGLESTKYETQTEDELKSEVSTNQSTSAGAGQKRGKYLQNPEEATIINSETNEPNLSIPSTADVWALAAMKNVDHSNRRAGFNVNDTGADRISEVNAANGTSATKLLTDWMEIMKNNEFPNGSFLANDIPSVVERPIEQSQQSREENKLIEVTVTPPPHMQPPQSTTSARRFDESIDTTTEFDFYRPTGSEGFPSGHGRVSDNLYYEDFTTDLPDFLTTTATEAEQINSLPTVMTATTESVPKNDIYTVLNELSFDRKPTEPLNDVVASLESTSLKENYVLSTAPTTTTTTATTTTAKADNLNSGFSQSPTMPAEEMTETTEEPPRIIPLVDSAFTTEKKELEQLPTPPPKQEQGKEEEQQQKNLQVVQSTLSPTDITNNSIERHTETKVVESNNFPEYTVVGPTSTGSGNGVGEDDSASIHNTNSNNNSNNYLETASNSNSPSKEGGLAHEAIYFTRTDYPMTESSGVPVSVVGLTTTAVAGHLNNDDHHEAVAFGESGASEQSAGGAASETMTTTSHFQTTISSSSSSAAAVETTAASETMATTKTTTTMAPERIELETLRTNGHQMVNSSLDLASIGETLGAAAEGETTPTEGKDVNAIIAIVVSVIAVIALVLLVGFLYVMRKRQKQLSYGQRCQPVGLDAYSLDNVSVYNSVRRKNNNLRLSKRSYGNSAFEDPGLKFNNLSIQGLQTMLNSKDEIYSEFKEIPFVTARVDEVPAGCEDKNRYANVVPLPETRVYLKQLNGDEKTEYINANYVRGPKDNTNYYIACQAPMENTIVDFWRMIWEQNCKVICMLTDLTENGIEKCAEYLPPSAVLDTNRVFGDQYSVTLKNREVKDKYAVSTIHLRNTETNTWREITHFWYQWPEEGMPLDETSVIAMLLEVRSYLKMAMPEQTGNSDDEILSLDEKQKKIQELNDDLTEKLEEDNATATTTEKMENGTIDKSKSLQRTQGPLTVHCSPGTGRTGTIIACDIALRSLEMKNRSVDVPQTVYYVRRGRASSIKTRDQYEFIYRCANTYAQKLMEPIAEN